MITALESSRGTWNYNIVDKVLKVKYHIAQTRRDVLVAVELTVKLSSLSFLYYYYY